jgi:hypothetical protein
MGRVGHEHPPLTASKTAISARGGAKSGVRSAPKHFHDPDLVESVKAWPTLPEQTKTQIKGLIEKHPTEGKEDG